MNCRFSIIIPLYNKEKWVMRTLDSLKAQSYAPFEVIVIDDCSTDDSVKVVGNYARHNPELPIRLVFGEKNQGAGGCRNRGIEASRGSHLLFLDADDTFHPQLLSRLNEVFTAQAEKPAPGCVIFGYDKQPQGHVWLYRENPAWLIPQQDNLFLLQSPLACFTTRRFLIRTSNVAVSAEAIKGLSFDTSRAAFEGISFWFDVMQRCEQNQIPVMYLRESLHSLYVLQDSEIHKPLSLSQCKVPEVFRRFALSRQHEEKEFCKRICTTWFWHELSRVAGINKALFFIRFAHVLPFLSRRYQKPQAYPLSLQSKKKRSLSNKKTSTVVN